MQTAASLAGVLILSVALSSHFCYAQENGSGDVVNKTKLFFSYITSITAQGGFIASGAIPVVDWALEQINNNTKVLSDYTLNYTTILDSEVNMYACMHKYVHTYICTYYMHAC